MPKTPKVTYQYSRLTFKRDIIEPLAWSDEFRVVTNNGTFQMSKSQFYESFPGVVKSRSYQESGYYNYSVVPERARQFLLTGETPLKLNQARLVEDDEPEDELTHQKPISHKHQETLPPPPTLQNRYRVVEQLGEGGMGAVYEAFDTRLSRKVALKRTFAQTDDLRRAFEREARLLANLNHPSLPRVIDHFIEGQEQYLVMDYIPGDDLKTLMKKRGKPLPSKEVIGLADDLLETLGYLHGHEPPIIHRDIKPANLKLTGEGKVVLLDFGLAKGIAGYMNTVTLSRSIHGYSPHFASLEQMQGERTTIRSDLYSLAATLYYLLTGVLPPDALARAASVFNDEADPLTPIHKLRPDVPASLASALMSALSLKPAQRPQSAADMRSILKSGEDRSNTLIKSSAAEESRSSEVISNEQKKVFSYKPFYGWIVGSTIVLGTIPYIAGASISTIILFAVMPVAIALTLAGLGICFALLEENKLKKSSALFTWILLLSVVVGLFFLTNTAVSAISYPLLTYCLITYWMHLFART